MIQIIGANEVAHTVSRFNLQTGRSEVIRTILPVGRIIAEHRAQKTINKHCAEVPQ